MINEKALLYIIFFAFMFIMTHFSSHWIMREIFDSAGVSYEQVLRKRMEYRHLKKSSMLLTRWIKDVSENKKKTNRLFILYYLTKMPPIICLNISILGLFSDIFNNFLDNASLFNIALIIFSAVLNIIIPKKR